MVQSAPYRFGFSDYYDVCPKVLHDGPAQTVGREHAQRIHGVEDSLFYLWGQPIDLGRWRGAVAG